MDKPMPYDLEAEREILGLVFKDNNVICDIIDILNPEDFYCTSHLIIYENMVKMFSNSVPIDVITFKNYIGEENLKAIGGITYISQLIGGCMYIANIKSYAEIVKEKSERRKLIKACKKAYEEAYEEKNVKDIISQLDSKLIDVGINYRENKIYTDEGLMTLTIDAIEDGYKRNGKIPGISTGYKRLDNYTNGMMKGDLIIVAGRPSMGKTCFALNIADNISKVNSKVGLFELEMSAEKLGIRRMAAQGIIKASKLQRGILSEKEWSLLVKKAGAMTSRNNIFTDITSSLTVTQIKAKCKKIKIQHGLDVVIIDHLGLITSCNPKETKNNQIAEITRQLKIMAKELNVVVILLSHLNRNLEDRVNKRPMLSDLRDSGAIEQDADLIMFLYRDEYYYPQTRRKGILELIIAKQRDGCVGTLEFSYKPEYQLVSEIPFE